MYEIMQRLVVLAVLIVPGFAQGNENLQACGDAFYLASKVGSVRMFY